MLSSDSCCSIVLYPKPCLTPFGIIVFLRFIKRLMFISYIIVILRYSILLYMSKSLLKIGMPRLFEE